MYVLVCCMYVWEWQSERNECSDALALPRIGLQSPAKVSHKKRWFHIIRWWIVELCCQISTHKSRNRQKKSSVIQCFSYGCLSISLSSESMRPNINGETQNRAGLVVHERTDRHHLQIEDVLLRSRHCSGQHQHGTDVVDLLGTRNDKNKWVHK